MFSGSISNFGNPCYQVTYLEQHSMRIPTLQLNNSMSLTVYICLLAFALLCSSITCLRTPYDVCKGVRKCGRLELSYPFGHKNRGCGDPDFQLDDCDHQDHFPLLNISGDQYRILEAPLDTISEKKSITIINDKLWGGRCNLSGNYSQFWLSGSHFEIVNITYTNITLGRHCDEKKVGSFPKLRLCDDEWYYLSKQEFGTRFCVSHIQVPIKKFLVESKHINGSVVQNKQNFSADPWHINGSLVQNKQNFSVEPQQSNRWALQINQTFLGQGFEITWNVDTNRYRSCGACLKSNGSCGYNITKPTKFLCYCPNNTSHPSECPGRGIVPQHTFNVNNTNHRNKIAIIVGSSFGGFALVAIILVLLLVCYLKKKKAQGIADYFRKYEKKGKAGCVPGLQIGNLPIFSYQELREATNGFHEENELGDGGFGSVYLGKLRDGRTVAIKRLFQDNCRRVEQFINEVEIFSSLSHPQLVRLFGCTSADSPELLLVYEFVPNGTLADHLHGNRKCPEGLPWNTRFNIAVQTAEALAFLHGIDPPIFHRDVKSSNILLDENFNVKVADFGLCRLLPVDASHVTTIPQGTPGYVDPQYYLCYQLTEKSDVYSFGVVLVEIISAKVAWDINRSRREINLANLAISKIQEGALHQLVDPQLDIEMNHKVKVMVSAVAELAFRCLASESDDRPDMKEVVAELEKITGLWSACPKAGERWGSFPSSTQPSSPTSVQDTWFSINSSPNYSP
eukprot:PITA_26877